MALASVVVPAHNEAAVIERCLRTLLMDVSAGELEVVVSCNGCTDGTAEVVRATGLPVTVIEIDEPSKIAAIRAADEVATTFPRAYVDADIEVAGSAVVALAAEIVSLGVLAGRPPLVYDSTSADFLVRRYYAARSRLPEVLDSLWGAGFYMITQEGHARVSPWPDLVADDLYVDRSFSDHEVRISHGEPVRVRVPRSSASLVAVLSRVYTGKEDVSPVADHQGRASLSRTVGGIFRAALRHPLHVVDLAVYSGFALAGRREGRRRRTGSGGTAWVRDETSREMV